MEPNLSVAGGLGCPRAAGTEVCAQAAALSPGDAFPAMVWSGSQALLWSFEEVVVAQGRTLLCFPGQPHAWRCCLMPAQTCSKEDIFELCRNLEPTHNFWFLR